VASINLVIVLVIFLVKFKHWALLLVFVFIPIRAIYSLPNILLLVAEDLSPRIEPYGDEIAQTPNLSKLARQSTLFTNAFTTAGVCAPSRAALITGQHQISFGGQHMRTSTSLLGKYFALPAEHVKGFPELLREEGYFTFTDSKLDYQFSGIRSGSGPFSLWDIENAEDTGWRQRQAQQPFFGLINFFETHESGVMRPSGLPHSATHLATQLARLKLVAPQVTDPESVTLPPYYPDIDSVRSDLARHYDNIALMDARVGNILSALEEDGLLENTVIIWTADHGDGLPRAKRELFDSGLKVPFLMRIPCKGIRDCGSKTDDRMVSFVDIAPTLLSLAQAPIPLWLHGVNFLQSAREYVFASRDRIDEVEDRQRAVRNKRFKFIRSWRAEVPGGHELAYRDNIDMVRDWRRLYQEKQLNQVQSNWFEAPGARQLYDLAKDPFETINVINDANYSAITDEMEQALSNFLERVGDTSVISEEQMRENFLCENEVCKTPNPQIQWKNGKAHLSSEMGASVGYQIQNSEHWALYQTPIELPNFKYKAIRYGFEESETLLARRPSPTD
jgi:arylsulfatase A-like enzyme